MALEFNVNIDTNGISNNIADTFSNVGNTMQIDKQPALNDELIAGIISTAVSLTGLEGLSNLASLAENLAQQAGTLATNTPEILVDFIYKEIEKLAEDAGVINAILQGLTVANNTVDLAKKSLQYTKTAAAVTANITEMATNICGVMNTDVTIVPSAKEATKIVGASLKEIITAKYEDAKLQVLDLYNAMIITSNDSNIDNAILSINNILDIVGPLVDPVLADYTGHTTAEARYLCNNGLMLIEMLKRVANKERHGEIEDDDDDLNEEEEFIDEESLENMEFYDEESDAVDEQITTINDIQKNDDISTENNIED